VTRYIGMDVHREFAQLAIVEDGLVRDEGRIGVTPEALREWAATLGGDDQVALEATGNSDAIACLLTPLVGKVVVPDPSKTRAIAEAKVKTDKVDARILAQLLAADFLPPVWLPDDRTRSLRRQVIRREHIVRQRTRVKNQVHAILARNLVPTPPVPDLFGVSGRHWLSRQDLPADERAAADALLRQLDFHSGELATVSKELAIEALGDPVVARLMTIPGVDALTAISIVAAVGDFTRFGSPGKLVSYLGLNPKVRQSGKSPASHGRISKAGRSQVRGVLVEAAWSSCRTPGPLRAFYQRIYARRGYQTAVVATARKLTVLAWHLATRDEDYAFARPGLVAQAAQARAHRRIPIPARQPQPASIALQQQATPRPGTAAEQAERAYQVLISHWQQKRPATAHCSA
jgi:transposase